MDADRFDTLSRSLWTRASRRAALGLTLSGILAARGLAESEAKKKRKKKSKRKSPPPPPPPPPTVIIICTSNCAGKVCGDDGCGGSCGGCAGGSCGANGQCLCPAGPPCSPGVCCANGQACTSGVCAACTAGSTPCDFNQVCGRTAGNQPCICATSVEGSGRCVAMTTPGPVHCFACATDEACDTELGLPAGSAVCIAGVDCVCPGGTGCVLACGG